MKNNSLLLLTAFCFLFTPAFAKVPTCKGSKIQPLPHGASVGQSLSKAYRGFKKKWGGKGKIQKQDQGGGSYLIASEMNNSNNRTFAGFGAMAKDNVVFALIWMYSDKFTSRAGSWQDAVLTLAKKINAKYGRKADESGEDGEGGIKITWNDGNLRLVLSSSSRSTSLTYICDATKEYLDQQAQKSLDVGF